MRGDGGNSFDNRELLRTQARIGAAAALLEQDKRDPSRLLAEGRPLAEAKELFRSRREVQSPHVIRGVGRPSATRPAA
jgi:hypothetical protein